MSVWKKFREEQPPISSTVLAFEHRAGWDPELHYSVCRCIIGEDGRIWIRDSAHMGIEAVIGVGDEEVFWTELPAPPSFSR